MILNRIEKQVDRIIAGLKVNEALKNVRFIREYGSDEAPSPVNGMIAVVSVRDMSTEKSYIGGYLSRLSRVKATTQELKSGCMLLQPRTEAVFRKW